MNRKLLDVITYAMMLVMIIAIYLMWTEKFQVKYSYIIIFFASIILILRLGLRISNLINKKKRG